MKYKIIVKTLQGQFLTFNVDAYTIDNGYVKFIDKKYNQEKLFPLVNTEIQSTFKETTGSAVKTTGTVMGP